MKSEKGNGGGSSKLSPLTKHQRNIGSSPALKSEGNSDGVSTSSLSQLDQDESNQDPVHITSQAEPNTCLGEAIAIITMGMYFGWAAFGPMVCALAAYSMLVHRSMLATLFLCLVIAEVMLPLQHYWPTVVNSPLFDLWRRYFRFRYVTPPLPYLDPNKRYFFAHWPHGTVPIGSWLSIGAVKEPDTGMPKEIRAFGASIFFYVPFIRHVMAWVGVHPADKQTMLKVLAHTSAGGLPEGIAGIFTGADRGIERLYFNRRKGYIKVAIEAGVDLVPIFVLGQSEVYSYKGLEKLSRRLKAAVGIFYGRAYTWLPYKTDMVVLVGKPIKVRQEDNPSEQQVDNIQEQMKQELSDMFYRHRHFHPGWAHRELEFV